MGKADLHVHTYRSPDALSGISAILKRARERQLDVVAITDHDTIEGAKEAKKIAPDFGVDVVIGEEVSTKDGGLIAIFIEEPIKPGSSALETAKEIHRQGGLAIVPHPDNWIAEGIYFKTLFKIFESMDGIELLNGAWFGWLKAKESKKLNNSTFNLAAVGGSDSHLARQVGCAYTAFEGKTQADLYAAIKAKKTAPWGTYWSYGDRFLWLLNSPRIFYKWPALPVITARNMFKRIFIK